MNRCKLKSIVFIIIIVFISAYFIKYEKADYTKVFTLDEKDFEENMLKKDRSEIISLNKVKKIPFKGICERCDFIDENNIMYTTRNSSDSFLDSKDNKVNYFQINGLNIKENKSKILNPVHNKSQKFIIASPDKKNLFYSEGKDVLEKNNYETKNKEDKNYIYNINNNKSINIDYKTFLKWMPDSSGYIGVKENLFLYDISNNKKISILNEKQIKRLGNIYNICITKDCKNIFLQCYKGDEDFYSYIYHVNLDNPKKVSFVVKGNIKKIDVLDKENLIFTGKFNNEKALYIYNIPNREINKFIDAEVIMFKLSNDIKNIAYVKMDKEGNTNLYAAKIDKNTIGHNLMLYKNIYIKSNNLNWSENSKELIASFYEDKEDSHNLVYMFYFK
ncbi:hypothetical protein FC976_01855 [Clostridium sporogenes]|uniref:hypothetical protein n=1 Tax=Clostridium sporogenes TaxID=1509 RepID=UPI0013D57B54|nr:hypothetical protein [Clostridium sporogenes]MCW6090437.1 hypothetical protein [Clostridium sporogenes]NFH45993.1 hypothetical protein [Clostridium sporogenes]